MHHYKVIEEGLSKDKASKALILLHGRGGSASDILNLGFELVGNNFYLAAPQATNNSWYPYSFMAEERANEPWLSSAVEIVKRLIDETARYISKDQIYLLGFSQGACLALEASTRHADRYGAIIAFTGGLIGKELDTEKYQGNFQGTKVFIGTSDNDPHVPLVRSQQSKDVMEALGANVTLKVYEGKSHTVNADEIAWVKKHIFA